MLSAAENLLADIHALEPLRGLGLVAAAFQGNPMADLPLYRQHAIAVLGPSLQVLDSRAVTEEERRTAAAAVAHEDKLLSLMVANSCLVHKLGRCVQQVRLNAELQQAVLGGRFAVAGSCDGDAVIVPAGAGASRLLLAWEYEADLGAVERQAIQLAIRREVARQQRKLTAGGAKPDSVRTWQQAYAAVGLKQQETIVSLLVLLEEAKGEAARILTALARPVSPAKRAAVRSGQEGETRMRAERELLIQELRDAFLGLAAAAPVSAGAASSDAANCAAEEYKGRIRLLHATLESAGRSQSAAAQQAAANVWEIPAVHLAAKTLSPERSSLLRPGPKSACKKAGTGRTPPTGRNGSTLPSTSLASAAAERRQNQQHEWQKLGPQQPQDVEQQQIGSALEQHRWQPDDSLALKAEGEEQQRCTTPRPFRSLGAADSPGGGSPGACSIGSPAWTPNPLAQGCSNTLQELLVQAAQTTGREQVGHMAANF